MPESRSAQLQVGQQPSLGLRHCVKLCLKGMHYRIYRAGVTVAIIALAVAFLLHSMADAMVRQRIEWNAYERVRQQRAVDEAMTRLTAADDVGTVIATLGAAAADPAIEARRAEYRAWAGLDEADMQRARQVAQSVLDFAAYLDAQPPHKAVALTGGAEAPTVLARLTSPDLLDRFERRVSALRLPTPLGDRDTFLKLIHQDYRELMRVVRAIRAGHRQATTQVSAAMPATTTLHWLAQDAERLDAAAHTAGYRSDLQHFSETAGRRLARQELFAKLRRPRLQQSLRRRRDIGPDGLEPRALLVWAADADRAAWLCTEMSRLELSPPPVEQLTSLAREAAHLARAREILGDRTPSPPAGLAGVPVRARWLLLLAFMVCAVGIANAMMMSVTERFREISTMKCLGALDGNIMILFLLESAVVAAVGGAVGVLIGLGVTMLRGLLEFGQALSQGLAPTDLGVGAGLAVLAGLLLAVLAAVWPAITAARLAPMEAMRVE